MNECTLRSVHCREQNTTTLVLQCQSGPLQRSVQNGPQPRVRPARIGVAAPVVVTYEPYTRSLYSLQPTAEHWPASKWMLAMTQSGRMSCGMILITCSLAITKLNVSKLARGRSLSKCCIHACTMGVMCYGQFSGRTMSELDRAVHHGVDALYSALPARFRLMHVNLEA